MYENKMSTLSEEQENTFLADLYNGYFVAKRRKEREDELEAMENYDVIPVAKTLSYAENILFDNADRLEKKAS